MTYNDNIHLILCGFRFQYLYINKLLDAYYNPSDGKRDPCLIFLKFEDNKNVTIGGVYRIQEAKGL